MRLHGIFFLLITSALIACSSTPPATNTANTANTAQAQNQSLPAATTAALSPTETMLALNRASKEKNPVAVKSLISKGTLEMMEQNAKEKNKTVDELIKTDENAPTDDAPEMRNERIEADKATVEVKNKLSDEWISFPFVKENGVWKVAVDRYVEEMKEKMLEDMKQPPAGDAEKKKK